MNKLSRTYTLQRFNDSSDPDFAAALGVYVTNIGPDTRTNSNEITYWLDRTYSEFGDDFILCGFYVDRKIIGFAELAFFKQQRVLVFDYLVLHKAHRSQGEYFQFVRILQEWLDQQRLEFDFAVAEVSFESSGDEPTEHSVLLANLFQQLGFKVAQCEYFQSPMGTENPQSDMRAHLLIASREQLPSLKKETLLHIVRTGYFNHHERWYTPFLKTPEAYRQLLNERYDQFQNTLSAHKDIVLNGVKSLHPPVLPSKAPRASRRPCLAAPLTVILAYFVFCAAFFVIQARVQLAWQIVALLFTGSLIVFAVAFALFNRNAQVTLRSLLDAITAVFGKKK